VDSACLIGLERIGRLDLLPALKDKKLLFNPRHDFFSLDAGALNTPVQR
jgi:hypothetical protein